MHLQTLTSSFLLITFHTVVFTGFQFATSAQFYIELNN